MFTFLIFKLHAQNRYNYSVDLAKLENDELTVNLICLAIRKTQINFHLPKIVHGTYLNSNYGKYVQALVAKDKYGKVLPS